MSHDAPRVRVALLAGTLGQGGAEKQLLYTARALAAAGVDTRVYSLRRDEYYEAKLRAAGFEPIWVGRHAHPVRRLAAMAGAFRTFRPHVIQSAHTFVNLYAAALGRVCGAVSLGALRNSVKLLEDACGAWTRWLIALPSGLLVNSQVVLDDLLATGLATADRTWLLPNALDLGEFDNRSIAAKSPCVTVVLVGRLIAVKRVDCFLRALAMARRQNPSIAGLIVGDGPERALLERQAQDLGLTPPHLEFLGSRDDVPEILAGAHMLVLSSDDEGCPNVVLEAMAARLPVITTPAGEARVLVRHGATGFVVPFGSSERIAEHVVSLSANPDLRRQLGDAGRRDVRLFHSFDALADRLLEIYRAIAERQRHARLRRQLVAHRTPRSRTPASELV